LAVHAASGGAQTVGVGRRCSTVASETIWPGVRSPSEAVGLAELVGAVAPSAWIYSAAMSGMLPAAHQVGSG
jgi:hypothetical protein